MVCFTYNINWLPQRVGTCVREEGDVFLFCFLRARLSGACW